jgi:tRNA modification GTPase
LRISDDPIEQEGIRRAHLEIGQADLVLVLQDATKPAPLQPTFVNLPKQRLITVKNKIDLTNATPTIVTEQGNTSITLSAKTGLGMELLTNHIKTHVGLTENNEGIFSARRRHLDALVRAQEFLQSGHHQLTANRAGELLAEDLRQAQFALAEITGEFRADDLLGRIFSSFCIGK